MARAERRAKEREEAKRERSSQLAVRKSRGEVARPAAEENLETPDEVARRLYRAGVQAERRARKTRRVSEKPIKWREGRQ